MSTNTIRTETVAEEEAWPGLPPTQTIESFQNGYVPSRIYGPARLIRLLYDGAVGPEGFSKAPSNPHGSFWCAENDVLALKNRLILEMKRQGGNYSTFLDRMAFALRDALRVKLAICHDWSPRLDSFARLTLPYDQEIYGLVGLAAGQPPYSKNHPGYEKAIALDTVLVGGMKQYVIHFGLPANSAAKEWVEECPGFQLFRC